MGEVKNKQTVEESFDFAVEDLILDDTVEPIQMVEIEKPEPKEQVKISNKRKKVISEEETPLINCLRNEVITVRFLKQQNTKITDPKHIMSGGLHDNALLSYCAPLLDNGTIVNVLTKEEKAYLEHIMGLEEDSLSVYKSRKLNSEGEYPNYWANKFVYLRKDDNFFDLSTPEGYIEYKILLANKEFIAPSMKEYKQNPKRTYRFVIISPNEEVKYENEVMNDTIKANMLLGQLQANGQQLRLIVEQLTGKPIGKSAKLDWIKSEAFKVAQTKPKDFIKLAEDPYIIGKVLIRQAMDYGLIKGIKGMYYIADTNEMLCETGQQPTLQNAAIYILSPVKQELKLTLQAKIESLKNMI